MSIALAFIVLILTRCTLTPSAPSSKRLFEGLDRLFPHSSQLLSLPSGILISRRFRVDRNSHSPSRAQHTFNSSVSDWLLGFVAEHLVARYPGSVLRGARTSRRPNTGRISATPQLNDNRASLPRNAFNGCVFRQSIEFWCATLLLPFWNYFNSILPWPRATKPRKQTLVNSVDTDWCYFCTAGRHLPSLCMSLRGHDTLVHSTGAGTLDL